jgi:adenylate cyclase
MAGNVGAGLRGVERCATSARMPIEIERKFLVASDAWRALVRGKGVAMRQGYLAAGGPGQPSVRIRIAGDAAQLTVKGPGGKVRAEFEYPVPVAEAEAMLALSPLAVLAKARFDLMHEGHHWTVDVFEAPAALAGLVLAEVELDTAEADPPLPDWLGAEVTDDPRYSNAALAAALAGA